MAGVEFVEKQKEELPRGSFGQMYDALRFFRFCSGLRQKEDNVIINRREALGIIGRVTLGTVLMSAVGGCTEKAPKLEEFRSRNFPYTIGYPSGWTAKSFTDQDILAIERTYGVRVARVDMFFADKNDPTKTFVGVQVNARIAGRTLLGDVISSLRASKEDAASLLGAPMDIESLSFPGKLDPGGLTKVAGNDAYRVSFRVGVKQVEQVFFQSKYSTWIVTLMAGRNEAPGLLTTFERMLGSMKIQE